MSTYTDTQILEATQLPERQLRVLITSKGAVPESGGKGVVRRWTATTVRYVARVSALHRAGLSLKLANKIVAEMRGDANFDHIDPDHADAAASRGWFDPEQPLRAESGDAILGIAEGGLVILTDEAGTRLIGRVTEDGSDFWHISYFVMAEYRAPDSNWEQQLLGATFMLRINLSLACRIAMRRLLGIEVYFQNGRPFSPGRSL
ncbi:hypothetical protein C6569_17095 [Phreatobacter cathodiphilus]|uniref:Uncharacterized protein n=2 Tax=Phreatobacter cathodiphilus TaxID=1868589 RepID=A0A2S0NES2_9HYPH|nr:hypothetical protein C6569_17095 [Phreatobacter cathodiphilus]